MENQNIYFSYQDKNGDFRSKKISTEKAGEYIGYLKTKMDAYEAILDRWITESGRELGPN